MGIFAGLSRWLGSRPPPDAVLQAAIDRAVDAVPSLRAVSRYGSQLAPAVAHALEYCGALAEEIPGPIDVSKRAFGADPLVRAMFAAPVNIDNMLGGSRSLRDFVDDPASKHGDELFALLGMRQREKAVLGMTLHGSVVQGDVPQRLLYFSDHTLGELASRSDTTRQRVRNAAFDSLTLGFAARVAELRRERDDAQVALSASRGGIVNDRGGREHLAQRLDAATANLAPERLLRDFSEWLATPEARLYLKPTTVSVDRNGVIANNSAADGDFSTLSFPELVGRDRRHWIVMVARISWQDAREALVRQQQANRYLLV